MKKYKIKLARMNPEVVSKEIGDFIINEIASIGFSGGVVGLSGGVDSTVTGALAKKAFDRYNLENPNKKLELVGYILPSNINNPKDSEDGINVAKKLGIRYEVCNIQPTLKSYKNIIPDMDNFPFQRGNIMAEIRAGVLHAKAGLEKKLVIGTGNRDEDFEVGYYTLYGDGAVHMSPIAGLPKRLVCDMANYLNFSEAAKRTPTAGLEKGQTDFKDLGYSYDFVELFGEGKRQGYNLNEIKKDEDVKNQFLRDKRKYEEKFGRPKFMVLEEAINDIIMRNNIAKAKSRIVNPPQPKITLEYK